MLPSSILHGAGELPVPCFFRTVLYLGEAGMEGSTPTFMMRWQRRLAHPETELVHTICAPPQRPLGPPSGCAVAGQRSMKATHHRITRAPPLPGGTRPFTVENIEGAQLPSTGRGSWAARPTFCPHESSLLSRKDCGLLVQYHPPHLPLYSENGIQISIPRTSP